MRAVAALALLVAALWPSAEVLAQLRPAGAVTGQVLVSRSDRPDGSGQDKGAGGALFVDLTAPIGVLRVGGALGVGALTSRVDDASRVFMPFGLSLALVFEVEQIWVDVRARVGMWGGATNLGLGAGVFASAGAFVGYALAPDVAAGVSLEGLLLLGQGDTMALAPGLSLLWRPTAEPY